MEERRIGKIKEFNLKMYEGLKTIVQKGCDKDVIKEPKFCRVSYNGEKLVKSEAGESGFNNFSDIYLDYFWTEFSMGENSEKKYKIAMFFKDFDHQTGNIHVLPGMIQFWETQEEKDADKYFVVKKGETSAENPVYPYKGQGGGSIFCEEGWVPCAYNVNKKKQKQGREFYMQWDYGGELAADEIADKLFACSDIDCIKGKMGRVDSLKESCFRILEKDILDPLFNEVYGKVDECEGENWKQREGKSTYKYLKWQVHMEDAKDKLSTNQINLYYKILYLEDNGYFAVYGNGVNQCIDYSEKQNGPNYVIEEDGKIFWKLMYE